MLIDWVRSGKEPSQSRFPTFAGGDLVEPTAAAMGWPQIPGSPVPDGHLNPFVDHDFGPMPRARDLSGALVRQPPTVHRTFPSLVPRVNADGNETAGVPSVDLLVPIGTFTGWNEQNRGYDKGRNCGFEGGFIPFARTRAERLAKGDPRLSLEERYGDRAGFLARVREAVARQQADGWLLPDDAARLISDAEAGNVLR
jgi:Alpha/beta hydrolase domain